MPLTTIISGGQTGADQGALHAARALGYNTGGWMPRGYRTDEGENPSIAALFGLIEHSSALYPPRTLCNVMASDATLIIGICDSRGCRLTKRYADRNARPTFQRWWCPQDGRSPSTPDNSFLDFLANYDVRVLNVAGNRERMNPGIFEITKNYLLENLRSLVS